MSKQINFLGYSVWVVDDTEQHSGEDSSTTRPLYSPGTIAAYCFFTNLFVGTLLYGINISRRGDRRRGRLIVILSALLLVSHLAIFSLNRHPTGWSALLLNPLVNSLVAIHLYQVETPNFNRAIRHGSQQAKWWFPLIWIVVAVIILRLVQVFVP